MSGFANEVDAINGLEKITRLISNYQIIEDTFLTNPEASHSYSESVTELYVKILKYQAIVAQHFGKHTIARFGGSIVGMSDWKSSLSAIESLDNRSRGPIIHLGIQFQQKGFGTLVEMFKDSDQAIRTYLKEFFIAQGDMEE